MRLIKLLFYRHRSLFRHIKEYGISNGWWMWNVENAIILDSSGEYMNVIIQELKHTVTRARWNDNEELADGIEDFISDIKKFQQECHPHLFE